MTTQAPSSDAPRGLAESPKSLKALMAQDAVKKRFAEILGQKAASFTASVMSVYNSTKALQDAEPQSILNAAAIAAALDLPINPNLGFAALVPYKEGKDGPAVAQFQIMWKGFVQLAHRTREYERMNLARVYEGQLVSYNEFTQEVVLDAAAKKSDKVIGHYFFFKLLTGYRHEAYWPVTKSLAHGMRYSKSFQKGTGKWAEDPALVRNDKGVFDLARTVYLTEGSGAEAMCAKTAVKMTLTKWAPLATDSPLSKGAQFDQAAVRTDGTPDYIDADKVDPASDAEREAAVPMPKGLAQTSTSTKEEPNRNAEVKPIKTKFLVRKVAKTDLAGVDAVVIRAEPDETKYYSRDMAHGKLAKAAMEAKAEFHCEYEEVVFDGAATSVRVITRVIPELEA